MSRWFRHYAGMMRDEKLVSAALKSKQPVERVVWVWGAILESAAEINDEGRYEIDHGEIAYFLRADEGDIRGIEDALGVLGRVSENRVGKWGERQFLSDSSAERQRRYRERHPNKNGASQNVTVTSPSQSGDAPETETELETKEEKKDLRSVAKATRPHGNRFGDFWAEYPKREGSNPKQMAEKLYTAAVKAGHDERAIIAAAVSYRAECARLNLDKRHIAQAKTWLSQSRWLDDQASSEVPLDAAPDWDAALASYLKFHTWQVKFLGPEPGSTGCQVPIVFLQKHGLAPPGHEQKSEAA